jgi:hypothetical protein
MTHLVGSSTTDDTNMQQLRPLLLLDAPATVTASDAQLLLLLS